MAYGLCFLHSPPPQYILPPQAHLFIVAVGGCTVHKWGQQHKNKYQPKQHSHMFTQFIDAGKWLTSRPFISYAFADSPRQCGNCGAKRRRHSSSTTHSCCSFSSPCTARASDRSSPIARRTESKVRSLLTVRVPSSPVVGVKFESVQPLSCQANCCSRRARFQCGATSTRTRTTSGVISTSRACRFLCSRSPTTPSCGQVP